MDFIEERSMNGNTEISAGRTYTQVHADNPEYVQLNEKVTYFDLVFRAVNPALSDRGAGVCVHIDVEPQNVSSRLSNRKEGDLLPCEDAGFAAVAGNR